MPAQVKARAGAEGVKELMLNLEIFMKFTRRRAREKNQGAKEGADPTPNNFLAVCCSLSRPTWQRAKNPSASSARDPISATFRRPRLFDRPTQYACLLQIRDFCHGDSLSSSSFPAFAFMLLFLFLYSCCHCPRIAVASFATVAASLCYLLLSPGLFSPWLR